jgi:hypothetical protein
MSIVKRILAVIAGVAIGLVFVMIGDGCSMSLGHVPQNIDPSDKKAIAEIAAHMPLSAFLIMLVAYAVGAFLGGLVATLITGRQMSRPAIMVGTILTIGSILNQMEIPHPIWFLVASTLIFIPSAWAGWKVLSPKTSA